MPQATPAYEKPVGSASLGIALAFLSEDAIASEKGTLSGEVICLTVCFCAILGIGCVVTSNTNGESFVHDRVSATLWITRISPFAVACPDLTNRHTSEYCRALLRRLFLPGEAKSDEPQR